MMTKLKALFDKKGPLGSYGSFVLRSLTGLFLAALFLTWFLEYRYFINNTFRAWDFLYGSPVVFLYNALILFFCMALILVITHRLGVTIGATWITLIIITYIHINKFNSRETPLLPEDFALADQASTLTDFIDIGGLMRLIGAILLVIILTILFEIFLAKKLNLVYKSSAKKILKRNMIAPRVFLGIITIFAIMSSTAFARHNNGERYEATFLGTRFTAWNQNTNYSDNGFILGFLYNLQKLKVSEPEGYSESAIADIKQQYTDLAEKENKNRIDPSEDDVNVVIILNESFYDPSVSFNGKSFTDYYQHDGGDITPNLHRIESQYPHGHMYSLDYGGGTANIEFEAFTSLTNFWINAVPYTSLVPKAGEIPSVARTFKDKNYLTTAIHPYNGGMYKRNISLENEGFDTFITEKEMKYTDTDSSNGYINDNSAYKQTLDVLKSSDRNQMIGLITMQNHTPYLTDGYASLDFPVTNTNLDEDHKKSITAYYQSLHLSDQYLGEFIDELNKLDKKVVVLFFGDHSAGLFDLTNSNVEKSVRDLSRVTPYFLYANYDNAFESRDLPTTTPNCMMNTLYNQLGWQKDAQYYLIDQVCAEEPILTNAYLEDRELSKALVLKKYELLTYDILSGKQYWKN